MTFIGDVMSSESRWQEWSLVLMVFVWPASLLSGGFRFARPGAAPALAAVAAPPSAGLVPVPGDSAANGAEQPAASEANHPGAVTAPMVGTIYVAPEPGAAPWIVEASPQSKRSNEVRNNTAPGVLCDHEADAPSVSLVDTLIGIGDAMNFGCSF